MSTPHPVHHVFVDFENVSKLESTGFGGRVVKITLFLGQKQRKIDATLLEQLIADAEQVHLVRLTSAGKNALDFTLAYYLGREASGDSAGVFHIISKDTGFDPLIRHLERQRVSAFRHGEFAAAAAQIAGTAGPKPVREKVRPPPPVSPPPAPALPAKVSAESDTLIDEVLATFRKGPAHRPKRRGTLGSLLKNHFHLGDPEVEWLVDELIALGIVAIDAKDKVSYKL